MTWYIKLICCKIKLFITLYFCKLCKNSVISIIIPFVMLRKTSDKYMLWWRQSEPQPYRTVSSFALKMYFIYICPSWSQNESTHAIVKHNLTNTTTSPKVGDQWFVTIAIAYEMRAFATTPATIDLSQFQCKRQTDKISNRFSIVKSINGLKNARAPNHKAGGARQALGKQMTLAYERVARTWIGWVRGQNNLNA